MTTTIPSMTKIEFLKQKIAELEKLTENMFNIDEPTGQTFDAMAHVIKGCIAEHETSSQRERSHPNFHTSFVLTVVAKIQAIDALYRSGVLNIKPGLESCPEYQSCKNCWESFFEIDDYPVTN